jgi:flagellar biosynthesis anti-sigma factor FlgM
MSRSSAENDRSGQIDRAAASRQPNGADEVRITGAASQLASLGERLNALPAIDSSLVERVSQALATGTYRISAAAIAGGLLQSEHALAQIDSSR